MATVAPLPSGNPPSQSPASATILVVDDSPVNLRLVVRTLEGRGYRLLAAKNGRAALDIARRVRPDLILLDVMMPRMSGFEVCEKVKGNPVTRDVVVIMVTALHEVGDFERAVECGTNDFITKPVNKLELLTRVRSLLELRLVKKRYDQLMGLKHRRSPDDRERPGAGKNLE